MNLEWIRSVIHFSNYVYENLFFCMKSANSLTEREARHNMKWQYYERIEGNNISS